MKINNKLLLFILSTFTVFSCFKEKNNPNDWTPELLHITIKKKGLNTLHKKRDQALKRGILDRLRRGHRCSIRDKIYNCSKKD